MWLRVIAVGLIGLTVFGRLSVAKDYKHDVLQGAHDTLVESGLEILPSSQMWQANFGSVRVRPSGCNEEVAIIPFSIMIDVAAVRRLTDVDAKATRIVYFDSKWRSQKKASLFLSLVLQRVEHSFGTSDLYPSIHALLLAGSETCLASFPVDLAASWRKRPSV